MVTLLKKCQYSELFWCVLSRIWTEYGEIRSISPYSKRLRENADQNNSEYRQFLLSVACLLQKQHTFVFDGNNKFLLK